MHEKTKRLIMDISKVRRENLHNYIEQNFKTRAEFSRIIGKSPSQVAMWFMKSNSKRDIGEKLARELEKSAGLPDYWLDRQHNQHFEEFRTAFEKIGYKTVLNTVAFPYNETEYCPSHRVTKNNETFLVDILGSHLNCPKQISMSSGLNITHMTEHSENSIILLFEDDLYFHKIDEFEKLVNKRLELARNGSPFDVSDFELEIGEQSKGVDSKKLWDNLRSFWKTNSEEIKHDDAIFIAKELLTRNGYKVFEAPTGKNSSRLMVLNKSLWSMPSLIVNVPELNISFYIDIYPEKRLGFIPVLPENKFQEILFIKQTEVIDIVSITKEHVNKWF